MQVPGITNKAVVKCVEFTRSTTLLSNSYPFNSTLSNSFLKSSSILSSIPPLLLPFFPPQPLYPFRTPSANWLEIKSVVHNAGVAFHCRLYCKAITIGRGYYVKHSIIRVVCLRVNFSKVFARFLDEMTKCQTGLLHTRQSSQRSKIVSRLLSTSPLPSAPLLSAISPHLYLSPHCTTKSPLAKIFNFSPVMEDDYCGKLYYNFWSSLENCC